MALIGRSLLDVIGGRAGNRRSGRADEVATTQQGWQVAPNKTGTSTPRRRRRGQQRYRVTDYLGRQIDTTYDPSDPTGARRREMLARAAAKATASSGGWATEQGGTRPAYEPYTPIQRPPQSDPYTQPYVPPYTPPYVPPTQPPSVTPLPEPEPIPTPPPSPTPMPTPTPTPTPVQGGGGTAPPRPGSDQDPWQQRRRWWPDQVQEERPVLHHAQGPDPTQDRPGSFTRVGDAEPCRRLPFGAGRAVCPPSALTFFRRSLSHRNPSWLITWRTQIAV